jgi:hypothetical protein
MGRIVEPPALAGQQRRSRTCAEHSRLGQTFPKSERVEHCNVSFYNPGKVFDVLGERSGLIWEMS